MSTSIKHKRVLVHTTIPFYQNGFHVGIAQIFFLDSYPPIKRTISPGTRSSPCPSHRERFTDAVESATRAWPIYPAPFVFVGFPGGLALVFSEEHGSFHTLLKHYHDYVYIPNTRLKINNFGKADRLIHVLITSSSRFP